MREMFRALSRVLTCVLLLMVLVPAMAAAQPPQEPAGEAPRAGGEVEPGAARPVSVDVGGYGSRMPADDRPRRLGARHALRAGHPEPAEEPAGAPLDAGDLGADLRDLQDLPADAGQVHRHPRDLHRRRHRALLRDPHRARAAARRHHPALQRRRHPGQLQRGVVRHPREHLRQLPHRVRQPRGQAVPGVRDSAQGGHEHRHAAHQRRAADHALHPALHPGRLRRPVLHRLRHRRVAGRRGAAHRRRHLHQDRRHRLRPDEDRLQHQGRRRAQPGRDRRLHRRQRRRLGGPERRRLRDLRRDRRRAHHLHPAGGAATRSSR